jgi:hypothetical protein
MLLLFAAALVMGIRSYFISDDFYFMRGEYSTTGEEVLDGGISFGAGWMRIRYQELSVRGGGRPAKPPRREAKHDTQPVYPLYQPWPGDRVFPGLRWRRWNASGPGGSPSVAGLRVWLHLGWALAACAMAPAIAGLRWWRRRHHRPMNPCPRCGYSLIGNTSGVCPECGERI